MKAAKARKLTFKSNKKYEKLVNDLNKLIEKECKNGRFQMMFYRFATLKDIPSDEVFNSLLDYLRRNGFKVLQDETGYLITW
jgi:hypothetical protein